MTDEKPEVKQHILKTDYGPAVRFTGALLSALSETVAWGGRTHNQKLVLYKTVGGNYVVRRSLSTGHSEVKDFKYPKQVLSFVQKHAPEKAKHDGPRDWSPRIEFGITDEELKFLTDAGPEFLALFFRDVE